MADPDEVASVAEIASLAPGTRLTGLDLPQLHALYALITERSVTAAAARLGRSQPTLSSSLARLRRHFGDELLVRAGNHYKTTPFADQLRPLVGVAVAAVERVFAAEAEFDPATSSREFTIVSSDYGISVAAAPLIKRLARDAPRTSVRFLPVTPESISRHNDFYRTVDGVLMPRGYLDLPRKLDVGRDRWVCVVSTDNPRVGPHLTMADLKELPWVATFHDPLGRGSAWRQMELLGIAPRISGVADSFLALPLMVGGTGAIAMVQERIARRFATATGVRVLDLPFDALAVDEAFWWHPVHDDDPGHGWLRHCLAEAFSGQGQV